MDVFGKIAMAFEHGGFWMYPIMLIQISSLAIIFERVYSLFVKRKINQLEFVKNFEDLIRKGKIEEVVALAKTHADKYAVANAVVAGAQATLNFGGKEEIQGKMDEVLLAENGHLERRTQFLSMFGNVATLLGLLGTITGMIKSFAAVGFANPSEKAALLASGISEAMNATAYGLVTAIPALLAYAILQNRTNQLIEDLNQSALKAFNWLSYSFESLSTRPAPDRTKQNEMNA